MPVVSLFVRPFTALLVVAILVGSMGRPTALADTTSQTTVSVEIIDAGELDVYWISSEIVFLVDGQDPVLTSFASTTASAELRIGILDTRVAGTRSGFRVMLGTSGLTGQSSGVLIPSSAMVVVSIDGSSDVPAAGSTLQSPVEIVAVEAESESEDLQIVVSLAVMLPLEIASDAYSGQFELTVLPLDPEST